MPRRKAPESDEASHKPTKLQKMSKDNGLDPEDEVPTTSGNPEQGGAAAQLKAVADKFEKKQQGSSSGVNDVVQDIPINPMAPVAKYARTKSIPMKADSPLNVTTPMPVLRNAEPNSVFGFRPNPQQRSSNATKTRKLNVAANPDNIAPNSEAEESVELEDHETEDPRPVDPEARRTNCTDQGVVPSHKVPFSLCPLTHLQTNTTNNIAGRS
ncbi:hypothetical protein BDZ94DRAFT_1316470 [Collybia nuda]|uniref:Uncharacterized protein n=1 Tax=Collybia nuda TaxID=64659 RepID=A0A9P5XQV7_9AGAR|nr:hypothetical protein BDZ94DRAFT_1316470 [Collybia nuda]